MTVNLQPKTPATSPDSKVETKVNGTALQTSPKSSPSDSVKTETSSRFEKVCNHVFVCVMSCQKITELEAELCKIES